MNIGDIAKRGSRNILLFTLELDRILFLFLPIIFSPSRVSPLHLFFCQVITAFFIMLSGR